MSDGANTSAAQTVLVTIPSRVNLCLANTIKLEAPKNTAPLLILLGAQLGACSGPLLIGQKGTKMRAGISRPSFLI